LYKSLLVVEQSSVAKITAVNCSEAENCDRWISEGESCDRFGGRSQ